MDNSKRAERLAEWVLESIKGSWTLSERKRVSEVISAKLDEAVEEAENTAVKMEAKLKEAIESKDDAVREAEKKTLNETHHWFEEVYKEACIEEGYAAARTQAALLANDEYGCDALAERIRAMTPTVGEEGK